MSMICLAPPRLRSPLNFSETTVTFHNDTDVQKFKETQRIAKNQKDKYVLFFPLSSSQIYLDCFDVSCQVLAVELFSFS